VPGWPATAMFLTTACPLLEVDALVF